MKKYYLTTPLYYVNDLPHIGHAYTTIAADVLARWKRLNGHDVFFLTGTDEHGAKIAQAAETKKESPQNFVNRIAGEFKRLWPVLNISYSDFIQTTEKRHTALVQAVFEKLKARGDIYKGFYEDWYCVPDETFLTESDLTQGRCPQCGRLVQRLKEESYFFKLSKYEKPLLAHYAAHPEFLSPPNRTSEIINFVKSGLKDLSVSRSRVKWGVPIPSDPQHVVYVWFDALLNYIAALKFDPQAKNPLSTPFSDYWPADVHIVGKEIYRFHTVIWPAMLMALGVPLPKKVFGHGWWTVEGAKMSKSLGNVVDPYEMVENYGADVFRYFLLREVTFGGDGDFSRKAILQRYNSELANNLGNLLQRTVTLLTKNLEGKIPTSAGDHLVLKDFPATWLKIDKAYENLAFHDVLDVVFSLMMRTNKYIDNEAPWKLGPEKKPLLSEILFHCLCVLKILALLLYPFMPQKMQELWATLGEPYPLEKSGPEFLKILAKDPLKPEAFFQPGQIATKGPPLFMRKNG